MQQFAEFDVNGGVVASLAGLAPPLPPAPGAGGNIQVVSVGNDNARCTLSGRWTYAAGSVQAGVACRTPGGELADSGFSIRYARGGSNSGAAAYVVVSSHGGAAADTTFDSTQVA